MERLKISENITIDSSTVKEMEDEVFSNLKALKYLKTLGMTDEVIKDNISKIYDFSVDMKNCKNCKGIKSCNKEPKYLVSSVTYKNGVVDRVIIPCKKYLEHTNFKTRLMVTDFPEDWLDNSFKDVTNMGSRPNLAIADKYQNACNKKSSEWIFMKGNIAGGKSFFAATLCVNAAKNNLFDSIAFINVPDRFKELSDLAFTKNPKFADEINKYQQVDFLVLDDFGNEFKSDFVRDNILYPILASRVKNKKFTIITSNYDIDDCALMYQTSNASKPKIEQIKQMLRLMCKEEITLLNPSLR